MNKELALRRLLWMHHGCFGPALYGDDGELQCHACLIDFRRDPVQTIEQRFFELGANRFEKEKEIR